MSVGWGGDREGYRHSDEIFIDGWGGVGVVTSHVEVVGSTG